MPLITVLDVNFRTNTIRTGHFRTQMRLLTHQVFSRLNLLRGAIEDDTYGRDKRRTV